MVNSTRYKVLPNYKNYHLAWDDNLHSNVQNKNSFVYYLCDLYKGTYGADL